MDACHKCGDTRDESALVCAACWDEKDQELIGASLVMATAEGERDEAEKVVRTLVELLREEAARARGYSDALLKIVGRPWPPALRRDAPPFCPDCCEPSDTYHAPDCSFTIAAQALGIA